MSGLITDETKTEIRNILSSKGVSDDKLDETVDEIIEKIEEPVQSIMGSLREIHDNVSGGRTQSIDIKNILLTLNNNVKKIMEHFNIR